MSWRYQTVIKTAFTIIVVVREIIASSGINEGPLKQQDECPAGFLTVPSGRTCYKRLSTNLDHHKAHLACRKDNGSHLPLFPTQQDLNEFMAIGPELSGNEIRRFWLSSVYSEEKGYWMQDYGSQCPMVWEYWSQQQVSKMFLDENCMEFYRNSMFEFSPISCEAIRAPLCQLRPSMGPNDTVGNCINGFTITNGTNWCYKLLKTKTSYFNAAFKCLSEGGSRLPIFQNDVEIAEMLKTVDFYDVGQVWIGANDIEEDGKWVENYTTDKRMELNLWNWPGPQAISPVKERNCAHLRVRVPTNLRLKCIVKLPVICQKRLYHSDCEPEQQDDVEWKLPLVVTVAVLILMILLIGGVLKPRLAYSAIIVILNCIYNTLILAMAPLGEGALHLYQRKKKIGRWIFLMLPSVFCLTATVNQANNALQEYLEYDVTTSYETLYDEHVFLPDIQICLHSRGNNTKLVEWANFSWHENLFIQSASFLTPVLHARYVFNAMQEPLVADLSHVVDWEKIMQFLQRVDYSVPNIVDLISYRCDDIVRYCSVKPFHSFNCCSDVEYPVTPYGACTLVKTSKMLNLAYLYEPVLTMYLALPKDREEATVFNLPWNRGITLEFRDPVTSVMEHYYTLVEVGFETTIVLDQRVNSLLNTEDAPCEPLWDYSQFLCTLRCLDVIAPMCNCTFIEFEAAWKGKYRLCTPMDSFCFGTLQDVYMGQGSEALAERYNDCDDKCFTPCNSRSVSNNAQIFKSKLSSRKAMEFVDSQELDQYENHTAILHIRYADLKVVYGKEHYVFGPVALMAELGGTVGAWFGASLMTVMNVLVAQLVLCCMWLLKNRRRNEARYSAKQTN